jgi:hypothetical protein
LGRWAPPLSTRTSNDLCQTANDRKHFGLITYIMNL